MFKIAAISTHVVCRAPHLSMLMIIVLFNACCARRLAGADAKYHTDIKNQNKITPKELRTV